MSTSARWIFVVWLAWTANSAGAENAKIPPKLKPLSGPPILAMPDPPPSTEAPTLVNDHEMHFPASPVSRTKRSAEPFVPQQHLPDTWTSLPTSSNFSTMEPPKVPVVPETVLGGLEVDALKPAAPTGNWMDDTWTEVERQGHIGVWKVKRDFHNLYNWDNALAVGLLVGITAPLANTNLDREIRDGYQAALGGPELKEVHDVGYWFGQHKYIVPVLVGSWAGGKIWDETHVGNTISLWGGRSCRAMMVGSPIIGVLQYGLGPSRPGEGNSHYSPFNDNNGASGHAFIGAIPFLTAARMTDRKWLKAGFVAASFLTAWSRMHDDGHYASQIILGWGVAYLAVDAVSITECEFRKVSLQPIETSHGTGLGVCYKF